MEDPGQDFAQLLLEKRAELDRWFAMCRDDYERQREAIDTLLAAEGHDTDTKFSVVDGFDAEDQVTATTRDFVRRALARSPRPRRMVDVVAAVEEMGSSASPDTIRGVLQKMLHSGEATRPRRGMYALASQPDRSDEGYLIDFASSLVEVETS